MALARALWEDGRGDEVAKADHGPGTVLHVDRRDELRPLGGRRVWIRVGSSAVHLRMRVPMDGVDELARDEHGGDELPKID